MSAVTYFPGQSIIEITPLLLAQVKKMAVHEPLRRARLCLHNEPGDRLHEMIIAFCRDSYVRPHRHINKSESFHVVEGELDVVFFDDTGQVTRRVAMGTVGSDRVFVYRLACNLWHTIVFRTNVVVVHETTNGPFSPEESQIAPWSPDPADREAVAKFMNKLENSG